MEQFFSQWGPTAEAFWVRALWASAIFLAVAWIASAVRRGVQRTLERGETPPHATLFLGLAIQLGISILGIVLGLAVLGVEVSALAALVGLGTVAITLSLQDITRNIISGLYLLIERPFQIGDTIRVGNEQGVIEIIELRTTILRNPEGERVIVPNYVLFSNTVIQKQTRLQRNDQNSANQTAYRNSNAHDKA